MSKTPEQIINELDEKIPRDVISKRDGGGGRKLDYLEGWYVIDRLNKILGHLNWSKEILDVRLLDTPKPSYLVKVRLTIGGIVKEAYGYGSDKSANNPHELAIKEAVTDALKVAAKDLGMSMGLALYDKSQENVSDAEEDNDQRDSKKVTSTKQENVAGPVTGTTGEDEVKAEKLRDFIRTSVRIGVKKGKLTNEGIVKYLQDTYKVNKLDTLRTTDLESIMKYVKETIQ